MRGRLQIAGYKLIRKEHVCYNRYLLQNIKTKDFEWWGANKNHASYGIKYRNTNLEYIENADNNEEIQK